MNRKIRRRLIAAVASVAACGAAIGWAAVSSSSHNKRQAPPTRTVTASVPAPASTSAVSSPPPSAPAAAAPAGVDFSQPESVAAAYVRAEQSLDWHWDTAAGYLPLVQPLSTPEHWAKDLAPLADAPSGATWAEIKAGHGMWTVTTDSVGILPRSQGPTGCAVRVGYSILMTGDAEHARPGGVTEKNITNVHMKLVDGRWLVASMSSYGDY